jgi:hypothetical protein
MKYKPSTNELCVFISWGMLSLTATIMGVSTGPWLSFLWSMYGNRNWPDVTRIYLSSGNWFWVIPFLAGVLIAILWKKNVLEKASGILQASFHSASVFIFVFTSFGAMLPFLSTTFELLP